MKNTQSLKLNRDFRRAYKGDNFVGGYTVVYMKKNKYQFNRLGLRVGKATGKRTPSVTSRVTMASGQ